MILDVRNIQTFYGESQALQGVTLQLEEGETVCLLGRNGAGKSTTLKSIIGLTPPRSGEVIFNGKRIQGLPPHRIARSGIGYVPEDRRIFPSLSVRDNLEVAAYQRKGVAAHWTVDNILKKYEMLGEREDQDGATLSGGQQQMLAVARSLMTQPRLLLLDEPNEGLAPVIVQQIGELIDDLSQTTTILFTDQSVRFALKHARRAYILEKGQVVHQATSDELRADQATQERFLSVA
ncbi:ABC transporter ATP-binding protein [Marinobacter sp. M3C]|jgi:branched-chain amino acid transport system ATP-binding protein|uniref:ABC transporter ATP-binding protein n=1 Tax=unclassified Marinobacter TaxID=83889 RepID=UPI00200FF15B|nr:MULTISPECIES: ABC transporter ATP-binding protein [unclassified Marinobacter]MCL1478475.1 ABC transporter ATP-binding protein [Marinobacter sp.]MCL1485952.1 ABC transporter ATP-binding protein [Marinobacter sp.]UQG55972.1 ABC transporter ATP-binding protein [Marinobacter sp. M4C]UQG58599.1 ABC transporter ATP-binding protein [Marinobacter sp. M3C]UQG64777.1 ABC transporter ATP-binding protein [Marinobacter sp. M2C]